MTNAELLAKIKAEIERRWKDYRNSVTPDQPKYRTHYFVGKGEVCEELLSFLDTLEEPKKDYNQLYKDIAESEWFKKSYVGKSLGDDIPDEEPVSDDLEEAAKDYSCSYKPLFPPSEKRGRLLGFTAGAKWQENKDQETIKLAEDHAFLAGADWQREQMMKEAVEGFVATHMTSAGTKMAVNSGYLPKEMGIKSSDKIRLIIVKED